MKVPLRTLTLIAFGIVFSHLLAAAVPGIPQGFSATAVSSQQINLAWKAPTSTPALSKYELHRSEDNAKFAKVADLKPGDNSFEDKALKSATRYYYRLYAINSDGASSPAASNATTKNALPPVTNLAVSGNSPTLINVKWTNGYAYTRLELRYTTRSDYTGGTLLNLAGNITERNLTNLSPGTQYFITVQGFLFDELEELSAEVVKGQITTQVLAPKAPGTLALTVAGTTQINLKWNDNADNETGFDIESSTNGTTFTALASVGANTTTYNNAGLTPNTTYFYRVRAKNAAGNSDWSNTEKATTQQALLPPKAPSTLALTVAGTTQINLKWIDNADNETGFDIESSTNGTTFTAVTSVGANTTTFNNTGLTPNTTYFYRVRAKNAAGNSDWSNTEKATTQQALLPPKAPSTLALTVAGTTQINLKWNDNADNETGFDIESSTNGTTFTVLASVAANTTTYNNAGLTPNTTYFYRVRAKNAAGNSDWSNTEKATTQQALLPPKAPSTLALTVAGTTQINLKWIDNADNETGFDIESSTNGTTFTAVTSVVANTTTFNNTGLTPNTTYFYRVRAKNAAGNSDWSNTEKATTLNPGPAAPSDLRLGGTVILNQINLAWNDNTSDETGFEISKSPDGTTWEILHAALPANTNTYTDKPVRTGNTFFYRVRTIRSGTFSTYSNVLRADAPLVNAIPLNLETLKVFPNPFTDKISVESSEPLSAIEIYDISGLLLKKTDRPSAESLDMGKLPAGTYILVIRKGNEAKSFRMQKI